MSEVKRNTSWVITASSPLLRPGLSISLTVSENYVVEEVIKLLNKIREINKPPATPSTTIPVI